MKNFIIYSIKIMLVAERLKKRNYSKELYFLTYFMLFMIIGAIMGTFMFLAVRLKYIDPAYARSEIAPFGIFFITAIPISIILFYRKKIKIDLIREQINQLDIRELKKEMTKGIILVMLSSCSILIAVALLSLLIKFNVI